MGSITDSFGNLSDYLLSEYRKTQQPLTVLNLFITQALLSLLPSGIRCGSGTIIDVREREVGPFDVIGTTENYPAFGHGSSSLFLSDGVRFIIQTRNWADNDLTQFGVACDQVKKLERKAKTPIVCLAVSYEPLALTDLNSFLTGAAGKSVDGVLCLGHHIVLRNAQGLYGNPAQVPFVTERPGPEAMKAFLFYLLHLSQGALGQTFGLADYQHL
jgi:hypothetical protein